MICDVSLLLYGNSYGVMPTYNIAVGRFFFMYKAYKYRIYPTQEQAELINKTIGCARFVYNALLADAKKQYEETGKSKIKTPASLKSEYEWLKEVDSLALCNSQLHIQTAYKNFFNKTARFPEFHSKHRSKQSYTTNNINDNIRIEKGKLKLPKLGLVKIVLHRFYKGSIKSVTVSRTPTNKYFASILTEQIPEIIEKDTTQEKILGIDMSYKELAVYSDGTKAKYPMYYRKAQRKLAHTQRNFSLTQKGSKRHEKARLRVAKVYEKISNQRKDFLEKESAKIVREYDVVVIEKLNMRSMANKGMKNGKTVNDIGFGMFKEMLRYKISNNLGKLIEADKFYPSSQLCSKCGFKNIAVKNLNIREWDCPQCGIHHDRDVNAAINLKNYYTTATVGIKARGENVRPIANVHCANTIGCLSETRKVVE